MKRHQAPLPVEDLQAANLVPVDLKESNRLHSEVTRRLFLEARHRLRPEHRPALKRLYDSMRGTGPRVNEPFETERQVFNALDDAICEHARRIGMRIFLSRLVHPRLCQWENLPNGAELHEKLGHALALHVRIGRGDAKAPIDKKQLKLVRQEMIPEVKRLQNLLKARFLQSRLPNKDQIRSVTVELIETAGNGFVHLRANTTAILGFDARPVERDDEANLELRHLITGDASPSSFVNSFLAWSTGRSEEALRQSLTRL